MLVLVDDISSLVLTMSSQDRKDSPFNYATKMLALYVHFANQITEHQAWTINHGESTLAM